MKHPPLFLPTDLSPSQLKERLAAIKGYRLWALSNAPSHAVSEGELKEWLSRSSYDPRLSKHVFGNSEGASCSTAAKTNPKELT